MIRAFLATLTILVMATSLGAYQDEPTKPKDLKQIHERIDRAGAVLAEIMKVPETSIPQELLADAECIAIVPGMKKGAFIVGARYGVGYALCRTAAGWSGPSTVRIEGGSVGLQIGGGEVDVVLLVMNKAGAEKIMKSEFTLGAEAGAMAGPLGRVAKAETDAYMHAKILSYSRSRGVFAGIQLEGATLRSDDSENRALYGAEVSHEQILTGKVAAPGVAKPLISAVASHAVTRKVD